ncbi:MAG: recombinase family protein [Bryobacteraceae bacterium]
MKQPEQQQAGVTLAYLRVSLDKQDLKRQQEEVEQLRREHGWQIEEPFRDKDDSGILLENRPGGKRLLERIRKGGVARIWVSEPDRLGRGFAFAAAIDQIEKYPDRRPVIVAGLKLEQFSLVEDETKILMTMLKAGTSGVEKAAIRKRTGSGSRAAAKDPHRWLGGPPPYGYTVHRKLEGIYKRAFLMKSTEPTTGNKRLASEVAVVGRMFAMMADGRSCREVADYLNTLGIPAARRNKKAATRWTPGRIRNLIASQIYRGLHHYGRHQIYRNPDDPQRTPHLKKAPKSRWIEMPVPDLAIVSPEIWEKAKASLRDNLSLAKSHTTRHYLLTGLVHCGFCGKRNFVGTTIHGDTYYRCGGRASASYHPDGKTCHSPHVRGDTLEQIVWNEIHLLAKNPPDETLREINRQASAQGAPDRSARERIAEIEGALEGFEASRLELHRQRGRGKVTDAEYDVLLDETNGKITELKKEREKLEAIEKETRERDAAQDEVRNKLGELRVLVLGGKLTFEQRRHVVRSLVKSVRVENDAAGKIGVAVEFSFGSPMERYRSAMYADMANAALPKEQTVSRSSIRRR